MYLFATHHKCASGWLAGILASLSATEGIEFRASGDSAVYPDSDCNVIYLNLNASYELLPRYMKKAVHIVRNPLDLVCSAYFNHKSVHPVFHEWQELMDERALLNSFSIEEGMIATYTFLERFDFHSAHVVPPLYSLRTWDYDDSRILTIRMEDLVSDPMRHLSLAFSHLGLVPPQRLAEVCEANQFERVSGGRAKGEIDSGAHYRSGRPDTWRREMPRTLAKVCAGAQGNVIQRYYPHVRDELLVDLEIAEVARVETNGIKTPRDADHGLSFKDFTYIMYEYVLGRGPSESELANSVDQLSCGVSPISVFAKIYSSTEALAVKHQAHQQLWCARNNKVFLS